jgi:hypothetical protein
VPSDFISKQGDSGQVMTATLLDTSGNALNLTGASVTFVSRAMTAIGPTTNLAATIVNGPTGSVSYTTTPADTAAAGRYTVEWHYTLSGGQRGTWPVDGYQEWLIGENLTTPGGGRLVGLGDLKEAMRIQPSDRSHDARLVQLLDGLTPVIENITGPILQRIVSETYDGGSYFISLRRRPVIEVTEVTEYRGPVPYKLSQVPSPDLGGIYTYMFEPPGRIVRRTAGGGVTTFPPGPDQVFVTYVSGYQNTPPNVREAVIDLVKIHYQVSEQGRHPAFAAGGAADLSENLPGSTILGFFVPNRVREQLSPNRRHPSVA